MCYQPRSNVAADVLHFCDCCANAINDVLCDPSFIVPFAVDPPNKPFH